MKFFIKKHIVPTLTDVEVCRFAPRQNTQLCWEFYSAGKFISSKVNLSIVGFIFLMKCGA